MGVISSLIRPVYAIGEIVSSDNKPTKKQAIEYIRQVFSKSGQEAVNWGIRVAECESGYNPEAANASGAYGILQFKPATFYANAKRAGIKNANLSNWIQQIEVAYYMFTNNQQWQWECK